MGVSNRIVLVLVVYSPIDYFLSDESSSKSLNLRKKMIKKTLTKHYKMFALLNTLISHNYDLQSKTRIFKAFD